MRKILILRKARCVIGSATEKAEQYLLLSTVMLVACQFCGCREEFSLYKRLQRENLAEENTRSFLLLFLLVCYCCYDELHLQKMHFD